MRFATLLTFLSLATSAYCETIVWSGTVNANGTPSPLISLELHKEYIIKASGFVNLGKWIQNNEKLANDACYEFNNETSTAKVATLRNSIDISLCTGEYRPDHKYQSAPFSAKHDRIHFWVYDTTFEDNSGEFKVEIVQTSNENKIIP